MLFNLRQLVENRLRQFALFEVEQAIISQKESAPIFFIALLGVEIFAALLQVFDLPKLRSCSPAFAHMAAQFGCLAVGQPEGRHGI